MMPERTTCLNCGKSGLTRIERVIQGTQIFRSYYCGGCEHVWQISDVVAPPPPAKLPAPKRRPR